VETISPRLGKDVPGAPNARPVAMIARVKEGKKDVEVMESQNLWNGSRQPTDQTPVDDQ